MAKKWSKLEICFLSEHNWSCICRLLSSASLRVKCQSIQKKHKVKHNSGSEECYKALSYTAVFSFLYIMHVLLWDYSAYSFSYNRHFFLPQQFKSKIAPLESLHYHASYQPPHMNSISLSRPHTALKSLVVFCGRKLMLRANLPLDSQRKGPASERKTHELTSWVTNESHDAPLPVHYVTMMGLAVCWTYITENAIQKNKLN